MAHGHALGVEDVLHEEGDHHGDVGAQRGEFHNYKRRDSRLKRASHQRVHLDRHAALKPEQRSEQIDEADDDQHDGYGEYASLVGSQSSHLVSVTPAFYQDITK